VMTPPTPSQALAWRAEVDALLEATPIRTDEPEPLHCPGDGPDTEKPGESASGRLTAGFTRGEAREEER